MKKLSSYTAVSLIALVVLCSTGCGRSGIDRAVVEGASKLPGAADVMAAIDKKDYDGAMAALLKVKASITTEDQNIQYMVLARQARDKISEAAATNAAAAEAVMTLRGMTTGAR